MLQRPAPSSAPGFGPRPAPEPLAIIGSAVRYPGGCDSVEAFWSFLRDGRCALGAVPEGRWTAPPRPAWRGGFLDASFPRAFDAEFFDIAPREAAGLDPQQRLLLEVAWRALEDAGLPPDPDCPQTVGVFVAISTADFWRLNGGAPEAIDSFTATGASFAAAAGRLSYLFGFDGPAMAIDTACSSSLVALHQAALALRAGVCEAALVAGVNALLLPDLFTCLGEMGLLSPDGLCRAFDAGGNGYVRAEGCGAVVVKGLAAAQAAGDRVLAVLRGVAVNQDGRSNGLTAPSRAAQEQVIARALGDAGLAADEVDYVETHGTGTPLGDGIELQALAACYGAARTRPLLIGSVKTNIGHLEAGAGMAGLIKTVEALRRGAIPAHLHLERPSSQIDWAAARLTPVARLTPWPDQGRPRRAAVSSFGFSGTNAHALLEQAPPSPARPPMAAVLLALSARSAAALAAQATALADWLEAAPCNLTDVAFTLAAGRRHFGHRLVVVGDSVATLAAALRGAPVAPPASDIGRRLSALGALWLAGEAVDWRRLYRSHGAVKCGLPGHPLAPRDHWRDPPAAAPVRVPAVVPAAPDRTAARRLVEAELRTLLGAQAAPLDPDRALVEQGLTSLLALELRRALEARFGRVLPPSLVFNYPSVARLAEFLAAAPGAAAAADPELDTLSAADLALLIERELDRS